MKRNISLNVHAQTWDVCIILLIEINDGNDIFLIFHDFYSSLWLWLLVAILYAHSFHFELHI